MRLEQLITMQKLLKKQEFQQQKTASITSSHHSIDSLENVSNVLESLPIPSTLTISQRVQLAMQFEKEIGFRRGRPTVSKTQNSSKNCQNFGKLNERIDSQAAKRYGLGNKETYRQAKLVVLTQMPELILAMDEKRITISQAAQLTTVTEKVALELLAKGKKAITDYFKQTKSIKNSLY